MTLTLELTPEVEAALRRKAAREGQDIAAYLLSVAGREVQEDTSEAYLLSHSALAKDWLRPEEDAAWQDL